MEKQNIATKIRLEQSMMGLNYYKSEINHLQSLWDNLSLLAQLSGTGTDMTETRKSFTSVSDNVLSDLSRETLNKTVNRLSSKAYVVINLIIRNLFERTADIGFLSTDDDVREFLQKYYSDEITDQDNDHLKVRFHEYIKKYSVYSNILLLDTSGNVLVQLDKSNLVSTSKDDLIFEALNTKQPYVEVYRHSDLIPNSERSLIYAYRVTSLEGNKNLGVLCLCFHFENEMQGIFKHLIKPNEWVTGIMLDLEDQVIASSDPYQIPIGAKLEVSKVGEDWILTRFAGREYLAVTRQTQGYQGYMGPGWKGHAMIPLEYAFDHDLASEINGLDRDLLAKVMRSPLLFSNSLLDIPKQAATIQSKLNQSVWNGNIWETRNSASENNNFSKMLLWEISSSGFKTQNVIERTVAELYQTVVSVMLQSSSFFAFLAVDIMDRNLYERANDCRWWALTSTFRKTLLSPKVAKSEIQIIERIIIYINSLYTVYDNILVFDRNGKILAVSNADYREFVDTQIEADWLSRTKNIRTSQEYVVSKFEPSPYYKGKPTYIYCAAIRSEESGSMVGGIGIVFDSEPQFRAMLNDISPRRPDGKMIKDSFTLFVDGSFKVVSSTTEDFPIGSEFNVIPHLCKLEKGSNAFDIALYKGLYYAVGACSSEGYREYKDVNDQYKNEITALIFIPLGNAAEVDALLEADRAIQHNQFKPSSNNNNLAIDSTEYATFYIGDDWMGVPARNVLEAVEPINIRPVPSSPPYYVGLYEYNKQVISVINLPKLLNSEVPLSTDKAQLIIMTCDEGNNKFGLLVSALGEIPTISKNQVEPLNIIFGNETTYVATGIAKIQTSDGKGKMLTVLSTVKMHARTNPSTDALLVTI